MLLVLHHLLPECLEPRKGGSHFLPIILCIAVAGEEGLGPLTRME